MDCLVPATQKGRRRGVCRQDLAGECALQQVTASGFQACSPVHQSLHAASSSYQRKAARRQAWDNRVYHHPSFTSPKSRTQPRHAHRGRTQAHGTGVSGCWPGADAEAVWGCCSQAAIEELELVSLLQVMLLSHLSLNAIYRRFLNSASHMPSKLHTCLFDFFYWSMLCCANVCVALI